MMNRAAGIGSLMRAGPAPGRAGLSHLGRGEMVVPNRAMQADPRLRQMLMQSMAQQGRNPAQYTVGGQNSRNPMTGRREFADMIYTDKGWVSPDTGQAMDFSGTGATQPYNDTAISSNFGVKGSDPAYIAALRQTLDEPSNDISVPYSPSAYGGPTDKLGQMPQLDARVNALTDQFFPTSDPGFTPGLPPSIAPPVPPAVTSLIPGSTGQAQQADMAAFQQPQTYDEWRQTRNPAGKGVPNVLFGQTQAAGSDGGVAAQQMQTPNVMAGQMPVPGQQWGTPGTALGMARDNTANDPSILKSGYNDMSMLPQAYSGAFGGQFGGAQSGIAFSGGQNGQQMNGQQQGYQNPSFGMQSAFRY